MTPKTLRHGIPITGTNVCIADCAAQLVAQAIWNCGLQYRAIGLLHRPHEHGPI